MKTEQNTTPAQSLDLAQFDRHTPGPWNMHVTGDELFIMGNGGQSLVANMPVFSAEEGVAWKPDNETNKANLSLMAAAPSLLSEVRTLRERNAELIAAFESIRNGMADDRAYRDCARNVMREALQEISESHDSPDNDKIARAALSRAKQS